MIMAQPAHDFPELLPITLYPVSGIFDLRWVKNLSKVNDVERGRRNFLQSDRHFYAGGYFEKKRHEPETSFDYLWWPLMTLTDDFKTVAEYGY